jgi:hypothetical protein
MDAPPETGDLNHPLAVAFHRRGAPQPMMRVLSKPTLLVTEFLSDWPDLVLSASLPRDNAYIVTLHLRGRPKGAMQVEGRWLQPRNFTGGNAGIVDLRMQLVSEYAGPFHYLSFYLTQAALDAVADDSDSPRIGELHHQPAVGIADPVVRHLLDKAPRAARAVFTSLERHRLRLRICQPEPLHPDIHACNGREPRDVAPSATRLKSARLSWWAVRARGTSRTFARRRDDQAMAPSLSARGFPVVRGLLCRAAAKVIRTSRTEGGHG